MSKHPLISALLYWLRQVTWSTPKSKFNKIHCESNVNNILSDSYAEVSNLRPYVWLRMSVNEAQHKIINLLKTLRDFFVITCHNVFNVWPKTTLLLPVWPRDLKSLDTPASFSLSGLKDLTYNNGSTPNTTGPYT